jgi:uncharacterized iron-regulated protein
MATPESQLHVVHQLIELLRKQPAMLLTPLRQLTQQQLDEYLDRQIKIRELLLDMDRKTAALPAH